MGRRSFISMTNINRLISASNRKAKEREREELIKSQSGGIKETPPTLTLQLVDFNQETRLTKIEILQSQNYRTITRYVTQNYAKYPIYSEWKTRTKIIKKSLKLTNEELENLNNNKDYEIRKFASEIILNINNPDLLPSWFLHQVNLEAYREKIEQLNEEHTKFASECYEKIKNNSNNIKKIKDSITPLREELIQQNRKLKKLKNKIDKIESSNKNAFKYIFSFFIYVYLISDTRKNKLLLKLNLAQNNINKLDNSIRQKEMEVTKIKEVNQTLQESITLHKQELSKTTQKEYKELAKQQSQITPLPTSINVDSSFIPLKTFAGLSYSKIIGCYIIHNVNNDKYNVGQSKDVIKRIKQHFKGTVPNNIIFAEDYYSAAPDIRDKLFEIKIIECSTKDELDKKEKQYIEEYSAFKTGYNGTNGNN